MNRISRKEFNRKNKFLIGLVQLFILGLVVLSVFNREIVIFVKDFIKALPVGSSFVEGVALRGYVYFQLLTSSPSLVMLSFVLLQVMIFAYVVTTWIIIFSKPFVYNKENVATTNPHVEIFYRNNRSSYLENMRLLF